MSCDCLALAFCCGPQCNLALIFISVRVVFAVVCAFWLASVVVLVLNERVWGQEMYVWLGKKDSTLRSLFHVFASGGSTYNAAISDKVLRAWILAKELFLFASSLAGVGLQALMGDCGVSS